MQESSSIWHCHQPTDINYNTNSTFPNKILPVVDHALSLLSAIINFLLLLTLYVRCKRLGTAPLSSIFCVNICIAHLLESANTALLFKSSQAPPDTWHNTYTFVASGIEHTIHFVRVAFMLPIYIIRLVFVAVPHLFHPYRQRRFIFAKVFILVIWTIGIGVGVSSAYAVFKVENQMPDKIVFTLNKLVVWVTTATELFQLVGLSVSLISVLCMTKLLHKFRPDSCTGSGSATSNTTNCRGKMVYDSVKSGLNVLLALYLTDLLFCVYSTLFTVVTLKIYISKGSCFPNIFVEIINYLGTPSNYIYSYHILDVLHGIFICAIFLLQKTMRQTLRFMVVYVVHAVMFMRNVLKNVYSHTTTYSL